MDEFPTNYPNTDEVELEPEELAELDAAIKAKQVAGTFRKKFAR
jgi:hypothetical protein